MRAIDLYAGVGGWALGLRMAGFDVTDSYEWWKPAITTHDKNLRTRVHECNIRELKLSDLPRGIDVVVGSPPCTQFSFSNRGGKGDIADGLVDIEKFLEIVSFLKPAFWAMENVPRVKEILDVELAAGGRLERFAHLGTKSVIVDMSEFGLPQKRRRCIAGNFDFKLLLSYRLGCKRRTLGDVLSALSKSKVVDPIYGITQTQKALTDQETETPLNEEEERMNRESKMFHPVYNNMAFPDPETSPVRTITATCTRVSRESVIVRAPSNPTLLRRLTVRERASLQGFPISYEFFGNAYAQKIKMVGNAIPPIMSFYIAQAMQGAAGVAVIPPEQGIKKFIPTAERAPKTAPDKEGRTYPANRTFRAAIPNLRFKSGVRFEIANKFETADVAKWQARFYFGNSKDIRELSLDAKLLEKCRRQAVDEKAWSSIARPLEMLSRYARGIDAQAMQDAWSHRSRDVPPYELVDVAGDVAEKVIAALGKIDRFKIESFVVEELGLGETKDEKGNLKKGGPSLKVRRYAVSILAGFFVGSTLNYAFKRNVEPVSSRHRERAVA